MKILITLLAMATLLLFALMASHFLIYKPLIVQRLPGLHAVPLLWWLGVIAPQLIVLLIFGIGLKAWRDLIISLSLRRLLSKSLVTFCGLGMNPAT
jgi:hypothetical protein